MSAPRILIINLTVSPADSIKLRIVKEYKIILANASIRNGNLGCLALSYSALSVLDSIIRDSGATAVFYLPDSGLTGDKQYSVVFPDGKSLVFQAFDYPWSVFYRQKLAAVVCFWKTIKRIRLFKSADYVFDIGQGDSFSDIYGIRRFNAIDLVHRLARLFNKDYILLPQTIGPFQSKEAEMKASISLKKAQTVMARDDISAEYSLKTVPGMKVHSYIDLAFFLPYERVSFDSGHIHVGLNISALLWNGGYTGNNQFGLKSDYRKSVTAIIDYFLQRQEVVLHLVPHIVGEESNVENDYLLSKSICEESNNDRLVLSPLFKTPCEAKGYIAGLSFFIGARMHSAIAAFSSGVPVLPMAYSRKFNGLFQDTLEYPYIADMKVLDHTGIMDMVVDTFTRREDIRLSIGNILSTTVKRKKESFLSDLKAILNG